LWWAHDSQVEIMDGTMPLGTFSVDSIGDIIPQPDHPIDLTKPTLVAGQKWQSVIEPFAPPAPPGVADGRRVTRRRVSRVGVTVAHSSGFLLAKLYSGPQGANLPFAGQIIGTRRIPAYRQGDDPNLPPPLRETTEQFRMLGRSFDPRFAIVKDTPGPLRLIEVGMEASG
jgi:hypothetical protein